MAIKTKDELKALFETGDRPTQQDFIDLFDSLVGKNEQVAANTWQPPNSPVYMSTGQELTMTHPTIVNENYSISVAQEIPGESGKTNISIDFAQAAEGNYNQEDSVTGTDFIGGVISLHKQYGTPSYSETLSSGNRTALIAATWSADIPRNGAVASQLVDGSTATVYINKVFGSAGHYVTFDFGVAGVLIKEATFYVQNQTAGASFGMYYLQGSMDNSTWTNLSELTELGERLNRNTMLPYVFSCESNLTAFRYYRFYQEQSTGNSDGYFGECTFKVAPIVYSAGPYYVTTNDSSHFSCVQASKIESLSVIYNKPANTAIKCLASFDGRVTWRYFNGIAWVESSNIKVENSTLEELSLGFSNYAITDEEFIDIAFILSTTDVLCTPSVDQVTIVYTDNSHYEMSTIGSYTSSYDFGLKRVDPTTTLLKRLNDNPGKVFVTMTIN